MELQTIWGWQPALYLFLGGVGAGAFIASGVLVLVDRERARGVAGASMWAALVCLCVGLLLLLSELTNPVRGLLLWQSFSNGASWMTYGAWGLLLALAVFFASALAVGRASRDAIIKRWPGFAAKERGATTALVIAGMLLALFVAVYTGMLLMAVPGVPLWNTPLLPCLFAVSALDTGVALVELVALALAKRHALSKRLMRLLERSVVALVAIEAAVLLVFMLAMQSGAAAAAGSVAATAALSAPMLVTGELAPFFWGLLVACGLALPFAAALVCLTRGRKRGTEKAPAGEPADATAAEASHGGALIALGAAGALAGGCALRFLILLAGVHADLVTSTAMRLFS